MNNYIYLISPEECLLTVNGEFFGNIYGTPFELVTEYSSILYITLNPLTDAIPYSFKLSFTEGKITCPERYADIITMPANRYELKLKFERRPTILPPAILAQSKLKTDTKPARKYALSVLQEDKTRLIIDDGKVPFVHTLPEGLTDYRIKAETLAPDTFVAAVTALAPAARETTHRKTYLLIVTSDKSNPSITVRLEALADKVEQKGDRIQILKLVTDIAARGHMQVYGAADFALYEDYYVYSQGAPGRTVLQELMPAAVFQAVKCGDMAEAHNYLTPDLNSILPPEKLTDFFAEFDRIIPNNYYLNIADSFLLVRPDNTSALYRAGFSGNKIDNFSEVEL